MNRLAGLVLVAVLAAGCATTTTTAATPPPGQQVYVGEVWGWDEQASTVTLMQTGKRVHVKVSPDQMRTLRLHQTARVVGVPAPPADVVVTRPARPMRPVPRGAAEQVELSGTVAAVDPSGRLSITTDRGPLHIWVAEGAQQRFPKGAPTQVVAIVQPVDMVPATDGSAAPDVAASVAGQPQVGDHAVVTGRIIGVNPEGLLTVESPTGPIQIWVRDASRYRVGDFVQVRTTARAQSS